MMKSNGEEGWKPDRGAVLRTIISVDPRPDGVEDVLNVCPQQAVLFRELIIPLFPNEYTGEIVRLL